MKKKSVSRSAFLNVRFLAGIGFFGCILVTALITMAMDGRARQDVTNSSGRFGSVTARSARTNLRSAAPAGAAQWFWQRPLPQGNPLYAVSFADPNTEVAVGEDATILKTTDGGAHWNIQTSGYQGAGVQLFGVSFTDASHGTAVGSNFFFSGGGNAVVLRTTDGGGTWATKYSNPTPGILLFGVSFTDADTGTVVGVDFNVGVALILRTTDGGDTWSNQDAPPALPSR